MDGVTHNPEDKNLATVSLAPENRILLMIEEFHSVFYTGWPVLTSRCRLIRARDLCSYSELPPCSASDVTTFMALYK